MLKIFKVLLTTAAGEWTATLVLTQWANPMPAGNPASFKAAGNSGMHACVHAYVLAS
jgi:hypothetical protein